MTRRCKDIGLGCRPEINVVPTSHIHVVITLMLRRCKTAVFIICTWLVNKCISKHLIANTNVSLDSNANANANATFQERIQMQM